MFLLDRNCWNISEYPGDFCEPHGTGLLGDEPLVCDRGADPLHIGMPGASREVLLPDGPFAVTTADWAGNGKRTAVVTLRDSGQVAIVTGDGMVVLVELPGARYVAAAVSMDMDEDGDPDAVGIACAEGGVCWWENPGPTGSEWFRHDLDPGVSGPKSVAVSDGRILVAALFSPSMLYGPGERRLLPQGCTAFAFSSEGSVFAMGHRSGFIMEFNETPSP